jgi:hypothetical protein
LERRDLPSGLEPTAVEQLFLEQLNNARANPAAYGAAIGVDLSAVAPSQPLAFNPLLVESARGHSQDMNARAYFAHNTPEGIDPGQRITAAGFPWMSWSESIAGGYASTDAALQGLITDTGVADLGHRMQLLAMDSTSQGENEVGVGIVMGGTGPFTNYFTIDSAVTANSQAFLTGVVFNDNNHNGQYAIGEGVGGVTITVQGVGQTTTFASGGYSVQLAPGTYTVTASGGTLAGQITQNVTIGTTNVRMNFNAAAAVLPPVVPPAPVPPTPVLPPAILPLTGPLLATGSDAGGNPEVRVFNARTGTLLDDFMAYGGGFQGGVRVAVGDVNGDGVSDIITAPGPGGGPDVRVLDGRTGAPIRDFMAYAPGFTGGLYVAAADLNGDGKADIITSPGPGGGPDVRVFDGATGAISREFMAYSPLFLGGVRVAVGDVNGNGVADIITAPGPSGGPEVRVFDGKTGVVIRDFLAYAPNFTGGLFVAAGDVNGDGKADIITAPDAGGGPDVRVFSGATGAILQEFMAVSPAFQGGVRVATATIAGRVDILTAAGPGGGPVATVFDGSTTAAVESFFAFDPNFPGGVFVGGQ